MQDKHQNSISHFKGVVSLSLVGDIHQYDDL